MPACSLPGLPGAPDLAASLLGPPGLPRAPDLAAALLGPPGLPGAPDLAASLLGPPGLPGLAASFPGLPFAPFFWPALPGDVPVVACSPAMYHSAPARQLRCTQGSPTQCKGVRAA